MPPNDSARREPNSQTPRSVLNSSRMTLVLTAILAIELTGGILYVVLRASQALKPKNLVIAAEQTVRKQYPEFRQDLKAAIRKKGPEIARKVSKEIIASGPNAREYVRGFIVRQMDYGLDEATEISVDQFRAFVKENHEQIAKALDRLEDAPEEAEQLVLQMENSLEMHLGTDIRDQARRTLRMHRQMNDKLGRLADAHATLNPQELLERRMLRILKALAEKHFPELTKEPEPRRATSDITG